MDWEGEDGRRWAADADHYRRMLASFVEVLLAPAGPQPGEVVVDVGCGNGDVALAVARAVGPTGTVVGVDLSSDMLGVARAQAATAGLDHLRFEQADATVWSPGESRVDLVVSRFGVMFFDDPVAAFANLRAAMRPGGRLVFVCWRAPADNPWVSVPFTAMADILPLPQADDPFAPGPFALMDASRTAGILTAAGFDPPAIEQVDVPMWMGANAAEAVAFIRTTGVGRLLFDAATAEQAEEAAARAMAALTPVEGPDGVVLGGSAWLVTATTTA